MCISAVILTHNEEANIRDCISALFWCDDIVVFDSYSSDRTVQIAQQLGVRVFQRHFDNYANQRNAAMTDVNYKHQWLLFVDADERWFDDIHAEMMQAIKESASDTALFRIKRKDFFGGRWLRHASGYPTWFGRLIRIGRVKVRREINEEYHTDGSVGYVNGHFFHYPFSKGLAAWFDRHNRYSTMEASLLLREGKGSLRLSDLFARDPVLRRRCIKALSFYLPCRPLLIFSYLYFLRLGVLDGYPGFVYCILRGMYECMIDLKVREARKKKHSLNCNAT